MAATALAGGGTTQTTWALPELTAPLAAVVTQQVDPASGDAFEVSPSWAASVSAATGISPLAVAAYGRTALVLHAEQPSCRLGWNTVAAIGWVESQHGTHGGAALLSTGVTSSPIVGPPLDGSGGTIAIRATARSTSWHGDPTWDHAVGPMQFLPSTWTRWAADGDRDGTGNPNDIDDAALAAGRYLCADRRDLSTDRGWSAAVFSFNHSTEYVAHVRQVANDYAVRAR